MARSAPQQPDDLADWSRVRGLWKQCVEVFAGHHQGPVHVPESLLDAFARHSARVFASYDTREDEFVEHLLSVMAEVEGRTVDDSRNFKELYYDTRFDDLDAYQDDGPRRRKPRPFEAAVETARRLRDLGRIQDQLLDFEIACILGGSASYGRFYNTVGSRSGKSSDLDLLLVLGPDVALEDVLPRLGDVRGITGVEAALDRVATHRTLRAQVPDGKLVFSHKFGVWQETRDGVLDSRLLPGDYALSLHAVSVDDFRHITLADVPRIENGLDRRIWDYRQSDPDRKDVLRSFSGTEHPVDREKREVEGGFLAESLVCTTAEQRYRPGLHQNLILPQFDLRWDARRHRIRLALYAFRWKIVERLARERRELPYEVQNISLSHTRSAVFAPHITNRVDRNA